MYFIAMEGKKMKSQHAHFQREPGSALNSVSLSTQPALSHREQHSL